MKIKRFVDKDSRSALARVRAELGSDAVILSNKAVNGQVELVAARDFDESALTDGMLTAPSGTGEATSPSLLELQREMENLRGLIEGELSHMQWRDSTGRSSAGSALYNRLSRLGLSRTHCGSIADQVPAGDGLDTQWQTALGMLASRLQVAEDDLDSSSGIVALVGSTGVGKTTTIAKIAARYLLRHGGRQVALVTTDCYRIGGQEQLETFATYLGIPLTVATDGPALKSALDQYADRKLVLIDTAGMSQRDMRLHDQFTTLNSVGHEIDTYVVLSATAQVGSLSEVIRVFGREALAGAIITKLDEATSLGGVLDSVINHRLKLAYFGTGQKVPEDIVPARADYLINMAVELVKQKRDTARGRDARESSINSMAV